MNPYMAPDPMGQGQRMPMGIDTSQATFNIMAGMRSTQPWVTMFAILSFIFAFFGAIGGLIALAAGAKMGPIAAIGPLFSIVYFLMAGFYGYVGVLLWGYRSGIQVYLASNGELESLALAIGRQASFWRFVGILTAVMIALYMALIFFGIVAGAFLGAR
ncbi:MAG: hypothetical protein JNK04_22405 [Myxococcales bacterium]|nr:hypothetical protein [Myxococcales bacterium]